MGLFWNREAKRVGNRWSSRKLEDRDRHHGHLHRDTLRQDDDVVGDEETSALLNVCLSHATPRAATRRHAPPRHARHTAERAQGAEKNNEEKDRRTGPCRRAGRQTGGQGRQPPAIPRACQRLRGAVPTPRQGQDSTVSFRLSSPSVVRLYGDARTLQDVAERLVAPPPPQ